MSDDLSEDAAEFRSLVPFPDGSASFVNGFEAGMVWQRMVAGENVIDNLVAYHADNVEVFRRMAGAQGYDLAVKECDDPMWIMATFTKRPKKFGLIQGGKPS